MDFITGLLAYKDKREGADFDVILVVINRYLKMLCYILYYKTITALAACKKIIKKCLLPF
jgi:hypothetical protein